MINNELTYIELEKIIKPIIKLEHIEIIKESIYKVLYFKKAEPNDKNQYRITSETTGINSTYKGFEIEIRRLNDIENGYTGVIIQFRKTKSFIDFFKNSRKSIVNDLKKLCASEIDEAEFSDFVVRFVPSVNRKYEYFYQSGTKNPDWEKQNKLSPLTIFTKEDYKSFLIEFLFTPECYERKTNKTILRGDWLEIFKNYTPSW